MKRDKIIGIAKRDHASDLGHSESTQKKNQGVDKSMHVLRLLDDKSQLGQLSGKRSWLRSGHDRQWLTEQQPVAWVVLPAPRSAYISELSAAIFLRGTQVGISTMQ